MEIEIRELAKRIADQITYIKEVAVSSKLADRKYEVLRSAMGVLFELEDKFEETIKSQNGETNSLFYIQNGFVFGKAVLWWARDGSGYSTDINKAGKYTLEQATRIIQRPEDSAWPCDYIDSNLDAKKTIVDGQYLDKKYQIIGATK